MGRLAASPISSGVKVQCNPQERDNAMPARSMAAPTPSLRSLNRTCPGSTIPPWYRLAL